MICSKLDNEILRAVKELKCFYTRYADDISISKRSGGFPEKIAYHIGDRSVQIGASIQEIIRNNGFRIHPDKTRLLINLQRQEVTGLVVNKKVNVSRRYVRQVRAMIHAWKKHGYQLAQQEHASKFYKGRAVDGLVPSFQSILCGKVEFIGMVKGRKDLVYKNMQRQLADVDKRYWGLMMRRNALEAKRDFFIAHASEDKDDVARPLAEELVRRGYGVWFDEYELTVGDSLMGKINDGLSRSRFGIPVLSPHFFGKNWPEKELAALFAKEHDGSKVILPVWHKLNQAAVLKKYPLLADRIAVSTDEKSISQIADAFEKVFESSSLEP